MNLRVSPIDLSQNPKTFKYLLVSFHFQSAQRLIPVQVSFVTAQNRNMYLSVFRGQSYTIFQDLRWQHLSKR